MIYAPTNEVEERLKDEFYEQVQKELERAPRHDVLIGYGRRERRIWQEKTNPGWEREMGRKGMARMNENGQRLAEFRALNDLVIGGKLFNHRDIHKLTWASPNSRDRNQIDHTTYNFCC